VSKEDTDIDRPTRWLAGFTTVHAEPGETRTVTIPLTPRAFEHWDNGWRREPGRYTVHAGSSVTDLPLKAHLDLEGR
jgi:beta-glucosidase